MRNAIRGMPGSEFEPRSPLQTETGHPIGCPVFSIGRKNLLSLPVRGARISPAEDGRSFQPPSHAKKLSITITPPPVSSRNGWGVRLKSPDFAKCLGFPYFLLSATATATATVAPTMGLLPIPRKPIISTWAGTEEEPANWASECIRPMVSVMP